jgi:hypothetical protein
MKNEKSSLECSGYLKHMTGREFIGRIDSGSSSALLHNRLRFRATLTSGLKMHAEARTRIFYGEYYSRYENYGKTVSRDDNLMQLTWLAVNRKSFVLSTVSDRLYVEYRSGGLTVRAGRQRINWGISNAWNPNDLFNAYNFLDFDYEERPGSDALRIVSESENHGNIELAVKPSRKEGGHIAALRYAWNRSKYDLQCIAGIFQKDWILGGGWAGSLGDSGFKGELTAFMPLPGEDKRSAEISLTLMADRTFRNGWYATGAFLFHSLPANMGQPAANANVQLSPRSLFPYRYSLQVQAIRNAGGAVSYGITLAGAPQDKAMVIFPTLQWAVSEAFDMDIILQSWMTEKDSKLSLQYNILYFRSRWSF